MKTDSIWYQLFLKFPGYFFELIGKPSTDSLRYKFGSVEVKELSFRLDGVFLDQIRFGLLSPSPPLVPPTGGETGGGDFEHRSFASSGNDWYLSHSLFRFHIT